MPYGITPGSGDFPAVTQPKLILDLATRRNARFCKAQLTWVVVISQDARSLPPKTVTELRNNQAVSWLGIEPATASRETDVLTTIQPSQ